MHYTTRFLDGLKPAVCVLVAIQQPATLDAAYSLALLYEELGDGETPLNSSPVTPIQGRRLYVSSPAQPPSPPSKWISKLVEEKRAVEQNRSSSDDKWKQLKEYRRAKGLCFTCGEKYSKENICKPTISLNVVQEMIDFMQISDDPECSSPTSENSAQLNMMVLSAAALEPSKTAPRTMQL